MVSSIKISAFVATSSRLDNLKSNTDLIGALEFEVISFIYTRKWIDVSKAQYLIIAYDKCKWVRRWEKLVSIKSSSIVANLMDLIV